MPNYIDLPTKKKKQLLRETDKLLRLCRHLLREYGYLIVTYLSVRSANESTASLDCKQLMDGNCLSLSRVVSAKQRLKKVGRMSLPRWFTNRIELDENEYGKNYEPEGGWMNVV
jgi:hypothetical protein